MSMDHAAAERWVTISAATVAGIYAYRRLTEGSAPPATVGKLIGADKPPAPLGAWGTAWGFTFVVVAIMAEASPPLGGSFAILIMVAAILTNTTTLLTDVSKQQQKGTSSTSSTTNASQTSQQSAAQVHQVDPAGKSTGSP